MKFFAHVEQTDEGCDYTIGCGHELAELSSTTLEEATVEALEQFEPVGACGERDIERIRIFEVANVTDIEPAILAWIERDAARRKDETRADKLAAFEKLKRELEEEERR